MNHQEALTVYIASFVSELVQSGVTDVVVSPGSRSTPIAMVMAEHPNLKLHIHVDERSAGFFALGIAKATKRPTALLCTSGTAAANYFPAIVEANISRVPLVVLTADRPHELRDVGAPQSIDQIHLYGGHVKWFVEMAPPEASDEMVRYARMVCARAVATAALAPSGPVHLNFPLREPLIPLLENNQLFLQKERLNGYVKIQQPTVSLMKDEWDIYAELIESAERGIIICGQIEEDGFSEAVTAFAEKYQFPILADPLSQLRSGVHSGKAIIDTYDGFLRNERVKHMLKPDLIIRFGSMPVSKALTIFLKENHSARQLVIDGGMGWRDPALVSTEMVYCQETLFCEEVAKRAETKQESCYFLKWQKINTYTKELINTIDEAEELNEGKLFHQLAELLPEEAAIFVGNSMPIRDLDSFYHFNQKSMKVVANRGANGIDGTVSTALGVGTIHQPLYLFLGDLTFFHDLNGLVAAKLQEVNITIILINNNGGGIFSFLPQSSHPKHFELLFGTPLDLDFSKAVEMFGGQFTSISNWEQFSQTLLQDRGKEGIRVIEIVTNREKNAEEHKKLWEFVSQEIDSWMEKEDA
ncbi:2-succinyl-5-enolpyruvyl-6-hydroxy-3-cyclohexene-1-carboxylic-acid synthase [Niallia endozanthoxylica]|uniref:2-succinyl-5-enolpyruvyl-6-hydroxy-3-cyclohexene-1-carboxylate synthase n=1 Tax=Niallia endozanthoxylica TaxID=2036016 RepID=A0A5J5GYJ0_9BACI|nr:2-succinyl-5-enolpyruvyl-6-hydroxy-3-cyclohexene-1-carboxylic-acid synthase [Niallia endozanthoxylica]KAA9012668.1 2-succinyl-5-enolpyruvyl-6-hydroxy-3-cyclohexene-1-carboxylic-acid synthase [Niallia endozanthoxylica]